MEYTAEQLNALADGLFKASTLCDHHYTLDRNAAGVVRAHAALIEENARLKKHAEAMAHKLENDCDAYTADPLAAYRAEFPKEAPDYNSGPTVWPVREAP